MKLSIVGGFYFGPLSLVISIKYYTSRGDVDKPSPWNTDTKLQEYVENNKYLTRF